MKLLKLIVALCLFNYSYASDTQKQTNLTRTKAVYLALDNNQQLKAVKTEIDAAYARLEQSGRLDNPTLSLGYGNDFLFNAEGEDAFAVSISQKFPLFGRLSKEDDIAKIDIELAKIEYEQAKRILAENVEISYIDCLKISEKIAQSKTQLKLIGDIKDFLYSSYQKAENSNLEYLNAVNEYEKLNIQIQQELLLLETSLINLKTLLALDANAKIQLEDKLEIIAINQNKFTANVLDNRPDYQILLTAKDSTKAQIALINAAKYEDIEVGIFFETNKTGDEPIGLKRGSAVGINLSIALPFKSYDGSVSEQFAIRRKTEELALQKEIEIKNEIRIYTMQASKLEEILTANHAKLISKSLDIYNQYLQSYKIAQVSLTEVFSTWDNHLQILQSNIDMTAQQAISSIKLNYSLGEFKYEK